MKSLYISRVIIKNYRNFKDIDVRLGHKQVIIGENNIGKTNFLKAIQLILDPSLSDEDRTLSELDFSDTLLNPMDRREEIIIKIYISNYQNNKTVLTVLQDATIMNDDGKEELLLTYHFFPSEDDLGNVEYQYSIYKADDPTKIFGAYDRKYLNIRVIKALRDVENEMRSSRTSPVKKMLDEYAIDRMELERIAEEYKKSGEEILNLDELKDLAGNINKRFSTILGNNDLNVSLRAMEVNPNKVLASLKLLMSDRNTVDISLGLNNILYISMILQMLEDKTIPTFLRADKYAELMTKQDSEILARAYSISESGNYFLNKEIEKEKLLDIYTFMDKYLPTNKGVTILAIEEPEAHLHPVNQRLIYRDVIKNNNNSVLLTTHSTHITAIAPIESLVHLHAKSGKGTVIHATADMSMEVGEFLDVERYLDVKRGEIYLGKAVILVEGIAEEYLVPRFAELLGKPLDEKGIIVCNVNSTNFTPYVKILENLGIPYAVITDGDFYYINGTEEDDRHYHVMDANLPEEYEGGYLGMEVIKKLILDLKLKGLNEIPDDISKQDNFFNELGFFVGYYTLEVDMMVQCKKDAEAVLTITNLFSELTNGGAKQKENFMKEMDKEEYWKCLAKIEGNGIGKGRFAQRFSGSCCKAHIPSHIKKAINYIYHKVEA